MKSSQRLTIIAFVLAAGLSAFAFAMTNSSADDGKPIPASKPPSVLTVNMVRAQEEVWPQTIHVNGSLAAWQEVIVTPETGGYRIAELLVDIGAKVKKGQLLARLSDETLKTDLRKQEAGVAQAQASLQQAASNVKRATSIAGSGALSDQKIEEYRITEASSRASLASARADLDSTRLKLSQTRIVAFDDGVISSKSAILGNVVSAGAELFRMVRQGKVEWRAEMDAQQLALVREGDIAHVTLPGGQQIDGQVRLVSPTLSTSTGRGLIYISLPSGANVRPGIFAEGVVDLASKPALTLPRSAIVMRDGRAYVYLVDGNGKTSSRQVTMGRSRGDRVEITSPFDKQATVVLSGGAFLSEGAQVTVATATARDGQGAGK